MHSKTIFIPSQALGRLRLNPTRSEQNGKNMTAKESKINDRRLLKNETVKVILAWQTFLNVLYTPISYFFSFSAHSLYPPA